MGADDPVDSTADAPPPDSSQLRLLPQHAARISESAILDEVAAERGYRTVTSKAELGRLGFAESQRRVPALLIPVYGVVGEIVTYQLRPDEPRILDGKPLKYETPKGARMTLDVPVRARHWLGDPKRPLFITEGARKADSGVSAGLCTIALLGVWNFRGANEQGGKVALAEFESIAFNDGREVYIVFDSDVMQKPAVAMALARLKALLESRGARVRVIYLPPGEGGTKVGLDDFFATGGTVEQLLALAQSELRPAPDAESKGCPYFERDGSTYWRKPAGEGTVDVRLANFTATITSEVALDDGVEKRLEYEIKARIGDRATAGTIPARNFSSLNWVGESLGARAIVSPGQGSREHLRVAIQTLSTDIAFRTVYTHSGWRQISGHGWVYLTASGAIGPKGPVLGTTVDLPPPLRPLALPTPPTGDERARVVKQSLALLDLAAAKVAFPILAGVYRATLGDTDFTEWLAGATGVYKTEFAALAQSHYGSGFTSRNLPGSWSSTGNSLELLCFAAKDALVTIDDFAPHGSRTDVQRYYSTADRVLRAQGNRSGRGRLTSDATFRASKPPRGMILVTGEDVPPGHSMQARMLVLEVAKGDIDRDKLTACQASAAAGDYASAMSGFVCWVAASFETLKARLGKRVVELRQIAQAKSSHQRTASIVAELQGGFEMFLCFAQVTGAIDATRAELLRDRGWKALLEVAAGQARQHMSTEPASVFVRLLGSALASGKAHIANRDGDAPPESIRAALGWRGGWAGNGESERPVYRAQGACVGWVDGNDIYLDPDAALKAAQDMGDDASRITVTVARLTKHLNERGYLTTTDPKGDHLTVRRVLQGQRRRVLHLGLGRFAAAGQSGQSVHDRSDESPDWDRGPIRWTGSDGLGPRTGPEHRATETAPERARADGGPIGPDGPVSQAQVGHTPEPGDGGTAESDTPHADGEMFDNTTWED